uniref:Uncharacterized protein n=1 Tax=Lotharella globosa TaxID=91324 RepID=A0A6V3R5E7_9EUKA|mmetsp:Transcript_14178/g.27884  ORF Transcript_14178/g.27884 Transcript_14178/m.27884 type:complete len:246 (-) Transcript_14178:70-807(-)
MEACSRYHPVLWWSTLLCLFSAIACLVVGHSGEHDIDWIQRGISTFAANAPNDDWVTASILLFALCAALLGLMLSLTGRLRHRMSAHVASMLLGNTAVGLVFVAWFEEVKAYPPRGYAAVRQQTFHDAGVLIFFTCSLMVLVIIGTSCLLSPPTLDASSANERCATSALFQRIVGLALLSIAPLTNAIKDRNWTGRLLGLPGAAMGLRQRASFAAVGMGLLVVTMLLRPLQLCRKSGPVDKTKSD